MTEQTAPAELHIDWHAMARAEADASAEALIVQAYGDTDLAMAALAQAEREAYDREQAAGIGQYRWARRASAYGRAHRRLMLAQARAQHAAERGNRDEVAERYNGDDLVADATEGD